MVAESGSSFSRHALPPPTQQGFAEPLLQISFHQLGKDLLSRSYYNSADSAESNSLTICTQQGDSVLGCLSLLHRLSKDLLSLPWNLCTDWGLRRKAESGSSSTPHRDSAEEGD